MRPQEIGSPESDRWKLLGISPIQIFIYPASVSFHVTYSLFETDPCFIQNKQDRHARTLVVYVTKNTTYPG